MHNSNQACANWETGDNLPPGKPQNYWFLLEYCSGTLGNCKATQPELTCWTIIHPPAKRQFLSCRLGVVGNTVTDPLEKQGDSPQEN